MAVLSLGFGTLLAISVPKHALSDEGMLSGLTAW